MQRDVILNRTNFIEKVVFKLRPKVGVYKN